MNGSKEWRDARRGSGRCSRCATGKAEDGKVTCRACRNKQNQRYAEGRDKGVCRWHHDRPVALNRTVCLECLLSARLRFLKKDGLPSDEIERAKYALRVFDGLCQACGSTEPGGKGEWCLDHDHVLKTFRGILCSRCNVAAGYAKDDPIILRMIAKYIEERAINAK